MRIRTNRHGFRYVYHAKKDPIATTALLYLKEALLKEQYEVCRGIIAIAKEFGADDAEIDSLLEDARRAPL